MKNCIVLSDQTARRFVPGACATALAMTFAVSLSRPAYAGRFTPPPAPPNLQIAAGNHAFLKAYAFGTQSYVCVPSASSKGNAGVAYALFTPEATLFDDDLKELTRRSFSPDPFENNPNPALVADGLIRAAWHHSRDSSTVWGKVQPAPGVPGDVGDSSTDPAFVTPDAVAWLEVTVTETESGPTGGGTLTKTTFIQRPNTRGGLAPSTGCTPTSAVGNLAFVPYTADYFLY